MDSRGGGGRDPYFQSPAVGNDDGGGGGGEGTTKRKNPEDAVVVAKQRALEIASRFVTDFESKRPRLDSLVPSSASSPPVSSFSSATNPSSYQTPQFPVSYAAQTGYLNAPQGTTKKILIPNGKVGVIIGRGGDQIKNLQLKSGARIQITRDADADPTSLTRDVELMGTPEQIARAEELINEVIADADAANSASYANRGPSAVQPGAEQFAMKVPNDKVALIIGKGGETIKSMQLKSGATIQVVPLHPPPNDTSTERSIYINGTQEQIDSAKALINEVTSGNRLRVSTGSTGYNRSAYPSNAGWAPQGQSAVQHQSAYGYGQQGSYPMPPPPYYGTYPPQQAGWDQTNPSSYPPPQQNASYNMYGQQGQAASSATSVNYNYGQSPTAANYSYNQNQGYSQQPPAYGQDFSGQAPAFDQQKAHTYPSYGASATPQPDSSTSSVQTTQPGYGLPPAVSSQADGTIQTVAAPTYATTGYDQSTAAAGNGYGYGSYPSYAAQPLGQVGYDQAGYAQTGYGQPQGVQISSEASQSYYGGSGYPLPQAPTTQPIYYQGAYGPPPVQVQQPQSQPPVPQPSSSSAHGAEEKADDGNSANGAGVVGQ